MAPSHSKQTPKKEGKKVVTPISAGVVKKEKKKEPPTMKYILMRAMRQNVGSSGSRARSSLHVGWALDQSNRKELFVVWYLATISSNNVARLTAPSGYGKPKGDPPASNLSAATSLQRGFAKGHITRR